MIYLEKYFEFLVAAIVFGLILFFEFPSELPQRFSEILGQSISVSSIIIGFLVAAKSILLSLDEKLIVKRLKATNKYVLLIDYLIMAIYVSFAWALGCGVLLFLPDNFIATHHHLIIAIWFGMAACSISSCGKIIRLLGKVLKGFA